MPHPPAATHHASDPNRPTQERIWRVERIGWAVLAALLLWALLGGAGNGPLAHASLRDAGIVLDYERFARRGAPTELTLRWPAADGDSAATTRREPLMLQLDAAFVEQMGIDFAAAGLQPRRQGNVVLLELGRPDAAGALRLQMHPARAGHLATAARLDGRLLGSLAILVFP